MNMREHLKPTSIIILFIWISFFVPMLGHYWRFLFIFPFFLVLLLILFYLDRNFYKLIFNKKEVFFLIFLLTMIGGIISVKEPPVAYRYFRFFIFPIPFLFFFTKIVFEERYGVLIIRNICLMASLLCIYGIIEFIARQHLIYREYISTMYYPVFVGMRMMSLHVHPAPLGTYFVGILPLAIILLLKEKDTFFKSLAVIYATLIFIGIILTFSRGALLGAFIGMFIIVFFLVKRKKIPFILALILLIIVIIWFSSSAGLSSSFFRYSLQELSARWIYSSKIARFIMLEQLLKEHPFFGIGFGHYRVLFDYYLPHLANISTYEGKIADCMYITLLAETGFTGFCGFMLFIFFLLKRVWIRLKLVLGYEDRLFLVSFLSGFVGIMVAFLTYDVLYWTAPSYLFWSYAGILSSLTQSK